MKSISILSLTLIISCIFLILSACKDDDGNSSVKNCCNTGPLIDSTGQTKIFIPNIFTPNGDGINDQMRIYGTVIEVILIQIFNSDENLVFEDQNLAYFDFLWDGLVNGETVSGLYSYKITIETIDSMVKTLEGNICSLPCEIDSEKYPTFDNIDNCVYGVQHDGNGSYNLDNPTGENISECLE